MQMARFGAMDLPTTLAFLLGAAFCYAALLTSIVFCAANGTRLLMIAAAAFFPIGIIHGVGVWFGGWLTCAPTFRSMPLAVTYCTSATNWFDVPNGRYGQNGPGRRTSALPLLLPPAAFSRVCWLRRGSAGGSA